MYGWFTYIRWKMATWTRGNVGKYSLHGSYGLLFACWYLLRKKTMGDSFFIYRSRVTGFYGRWLGRKKPSNTNLTNKKKQLPSFKLSKTPPENFRPPFIRPLKKEAKDRCNPIQPLFFKEFPRCSVFSFCVKMCCRKRHEKTGVFGLPGLRWVMNMKRKWFITPEGPEKKRWKNKSRRKSHGNGLNLPPPPPNQDFGSEIGMIICTYMPYMYIFSDF